MEAWGDKSWISVESPMKTEMIIILNKADKVNSNTNKTAVSLGQLLQTLTEIWKKMKYNYLFLIKW